MSQTSIETDEKKTLLLSSETKADSEASQVTCPKHQNMVRLKELKEACESLEKQILILRSDLNPLFKNLQSSEDHNELIHRHISKCMEDIKVLRGNYFHYNVLLHDRSAKTEKLLMVDS